jgi:hypothetical protein
VLQSHDAELFDRLRRAVADIADAGEPAKSL